MFGTCCSKDEKDGDDAEPSQARCALPEEAEEVAGLRVAAPVGEEQKVEPVPDKEPEPVADAAPEPEPAPPVEAPAPAPAELETKPEDQAAAVEPQAEAAVAEAFEIDVSGPSKTGPRWGIRHDAFEGIGIHVQKVEAGPFQSYNSGVAEDKALKPDDFIVVVNGKTETADMVEELKTADRVVVQVQRPSALTVRIKKRGDKMGISLRYQDHVSTVVLISQLETSGAVPDYNAATEKKNRVKVFDFIKAVNGSSGSVDEVVRATKSSETLYISLLRLSK